MYNYPDQARNTSPEYSSSFFTRIFYGWFDPLVWKARTKTIDADDLWDLNPEDRCR